LDCPEEQGHTALILLRAPSWLVCDAVDGDREDGVNRTGSCWTALRLVCVCEDQVIMIERTKLGERIIPIRSFVEIPNLVLVIVIAVMPWVNTKESSYTFI